MNIFGDSTIKAGDLVMIVRDCCGKYVGLPFRVRSLESAKLPKWIECELCKKHYSNIAYVISDRHAGFANNVPLHWLRKLDTPLDTETEKSDEKLTEGA